MNLRRVLVSLNDFIEDNINAVIIFIIIIINLIGFFATNSNTYKAFIFYPTRNMDKIIAEKREIVRSFSKKNRIKNTIDELLLGPINTEIRRIAPINSKLLNVELIDKNLLLNFNRETVMDIDTSRLDNPANYYKILLQSIVNTISIQFKDIKKIYFYFDGVQYNYLENFGPLEKGLSPDYSLIKK
jgi:spore germination protein GerM